MPLYFYYDSNFQRGFKNFNGVCAAIFNHLYCLFTMTKIISAKLFFQRAKKIKLAWSQGLYGG